VIATDAFASIRRTGFDYDGRHLAWWGYACNSAQVTVVDASTSKVAPRGRCRLAFAEPPRVSGGAVRLRVDCGGFDGCRIARLTLREPGGKRRLLGNGRGRLVRLNALGARRLARDRSVRARITAKIESWTVERRSATVTLHR
jgi:hypothetical protein